MREKVEEYIVELDLEIDRLHQEQEKFSEINGEVSKCAIIRIQTLLEVKNDLQGRLEELV